MHKCSILISIWILFIQISWSQVEVLYENDFQDLRINGITSTGSTLSAITDDEGHEVLRINQFDPNSSPSILTIPLPKPQNNLGYYRVQFRLKSEYFPLFFSMDLADENNTDLFNTENGWLNPINPKLVDIHANTWLQFDYISQPNGIILDATEFRFHLNPPQNQTSPENVSIYIDDLKITNGNEIYASSFETRKDVRRIKTNGSNTSDTLIEDTPFGLGYIRVSPTFDVNENLPLKIRANRVPLFIEGPLTFQLDYTIRTNIAPLTVYGGIASDEFWESDSFDSTFLEPLTIHEPNVWKTISYTVTTSQINQNRIDYVMQMERFEGLNFDIDHLVVSAQPLELRSNVQEWALYK